MHLDLCPHAPREAPMRVTWWLRAREVVEPGHTGRWLLAQIEREDAQWLARQHAERVAAMLANPPRCLLDLITPY